jgi:hypothetical protein
VGAFQAELRLLISMTPAVATTIGSCAHTFLAPNAIDASHRSPMGLRQLRN